jgi:hypothetical protein
MSRSTGIETALRVIAAAAEQRRPLPAALRSQAGRIGAELADALERGEELPSAFASMLPESLRAALRGPRPPLAHAAFFAAEQLRLQRASRLAWLDVITHPVLTLIGVAGAAGVLVYAFHFALAWQWLLVVLGILLLGGVIVGLSRSGRLMPVLPSLASWGHHARQAHRFERAALVARWRLSEAELVPLLGSDLTALSGVLAHPDAEGHCRRLAKYHGASCLRAGRRLSWTLAALIYLAAGSLLLSAAVQPISTCVQAMESIAQDF